MNPLLELFLAEESVRTSKSSLRDASGSLSDVNICRCRSACISSASLGFCTTGSIFCTAGSFLGEVTAGEDRLTTEGEPFPGNGAQEGRLEVWTYGHRNPQGLVVTPDGAVWSHEHGPQGGDELNRLVPGENYGWPVATFGIDYNGARISPFERYPGMRDSAWHWTPSIGPSGLAYVPSPGAEAEGTFYLGGLAIPGLYAAERKGDQILAVEQRFPELTGRVRDVRLARDGTLLVLTDGEKLPRGRRSRGRRRRWFATSTIRGRTPWRCPQYR